MTNNLKKFSLLLILFFLKFTLVSSEIIKKIDIIGNDRISDETILMFSNVSEDQNIDDDDINSVLKKLYESNFFKDVKVLFEEGLLQIKVIENPIIYNIEFKGIKSKSIIKTLSENIKLKERSSYIETLVAEDSNRIKSILRNDGYFFSEVSILKEDTGENKLNLIIDIQ